MLEALRDSTITSLKFFSFTRNPGLFTNEEACNTLAQIIQSQPNIEELIMCENEVSEVSRGLIEQAVVQSGTKKCKVVWQYPDDILNYVKDEE